jgi:hypothetical protein
MLGTEGCRLDLCAIDHLPLDLIHFLWREQEAADLVTLSSKPFLFSLQLLKYFDVVLEPARRADCRSISCRSSCLKLFSIERHIQLLFRPRPPLFLAHVAQYNVSEV